MTTATKHCWATLKTDRPMELLERRRVIGDKAMLSHITLRKGCTVPRHSHENEQFSAVLSGRLVFQVGPESDSREVVVGPGEVLHLPSGVPHGVVASEETIVLDIFSPPSQTTGIDRH